MIKFEVKNKVFSLDLLENVSVIHWDSLLININKFRKIILLDVNKSYFNDNLFLKIIKNEHLIFI